MSTTMERDCVIAGGGPAGMVLGYLLARAGLKVTVLEKHADFFRDFRGDTIHPSTITLLRELGLRDRFLELPLTRISAMEVVFDGERLTIADFSTLPEPDNFLVLAPQWDFLNFLASEAATFPDFDLRVSTSATGLIEHQGRTVGMYAAGPDGDLQIRATLSVAADGRGSVLRDAMGVRPRKAGVPIDVLWFRLPKLTTGPPPTLGYFSAKGIVITIDRGDYYQTGTIIAKGSFDRIKAEGLDAFRTHITNAAPHLAESADSIVGWDQVKQLSVQVNLLPTWHQPGVIAIGDAAHAMSPMFGVGVNYAIQDAVALANAIIPHLRCNSAPDAVLEQVQKRREVPVKKMQRLQILGHRALGRQPNGDRFAPRWVIHLLRAISPRMRRFMARFVGIGFLPEHPEMP